MDASVNADRPSRFDVVDLLGSPVELEVVPEPGVPGYVEQTLSNGEGFSIRAEDVERYNDVLAECAARATESAKAHRPPARWRL